jgi:predicted ATPase
MENVLNEIIEKSIYIITGGPGFGKTMLVEALQKSGYLCSGEYAREMILSQQESGGEVLPWKNPRLFQKEILSRRISFFESVKLGTIAFADRAIPDQLAFARYKGFGSPDRLREAASRYRYASEVFVTPPWPEIFTNDEVRTESLEEAKKIHNIIIDTYDELNYQIIELPLVPIPERVVFLLNYLLNKKYYGN